jgi:hypothetical protein
MSVEKIRILLSTLIIVLLALSGCNGSKPPSPGSSKGAANEGGRPDKGESAAQTAESEDDSLAESLKDAQECFNEGLALYGKNFFADAQKRFVSAKNLFRTAGMDRGNKYQEADRMEKRCRVFDLLTNKVQPNELSDGRNIVLYRHVKYGEILGRIIEKTDKQYKFLTRNGRREYPLEEVTSVKELPEDEFKKYIEKELESNIKTAVENKNSIMIYTQGVFFARRHRMYDQVTNLLEKAFHLDKWDFIVNVFLANQKPKNLIEDVFYSWNKSEIPKPFTLSPAGPVVASADNADRRPPPPEEVRPPAREPAPAPDAEPAAPPGPEAVPPPPPPDEEPAAEPEARPVEKPAAPSAEDEKKDDWDDEPPEDPRLARQPRPPTAGGDAELDEADRLYELGTDYFNKSMATGSAVEDDASVSKYLKLARKNLDKAQQKFQQLMAKRGPSGGIEAKLLQINAMLFDIIKRWPIDLEYGD